MKYFDNVHDQGGLIASYSGKGLLTLDDGTEYEGEFRIEHHVDLGVLMECDFRGAIPHVGRRILKSFTGTTEDGRFRVESVGRGEMRSSHYTVNETTCEATVFWHLQGLKLERADRPRFASVRYGITNFVFYGISEDFGSGDFPLTLLESDASIDVVIKPYPQYKSLSKFISLYRSIRVTCDVCLDSVGRDFDERIDGTIGSLCNVMSVARGTRIVWVYRYAYDAENGLAGMYHLSGWVGRFSSMSLFDDGPGHMQAVKRFIETAYPVYRRKRDSFELGSNLIESYLAAKAEGDLLARRGIKLAVALELLKHLFLAQPDCAVNEHVISTVSARRNHTGWASGYSVGPIFNESGTRPISASVGW